MIAKQLRIGNLVYVKSTDQLGVVTCINKHVGLAVNDSFVYLSFEDCDGIPITEDILLKLGFEKDKEISYRYHLEDFISYDIDDNCICIYDSWLVKRFPYLHQFMNLYFAILGEELPTDKILNS